MLCFALLANFSKHVRATKLQSNERTIFDLKQPGLQVRRAMISGTPA